VLGVGQHDALAHARAARALATACVVLCCVLVKRFCMHVFVDCCARMPWLFLD
jgi:hypothetical protein